MPEHFHERYSLGPVPDWTGKDDYKFKEPSFDQFCEPAPADRAAYMAASNPLFARHNHFTGPHYDEPFGRAIRWGLEMPEHRLRSLELQRRPQAAEFGVMPRHFGRKENVAEFLRLFSLVEERHRQNEAARAERIAARRAGGTAAQSRLAFPAPGG